MNHIAFIMLIISSLKVETSNNNWLYDKDGNCREELEMFCKTEYRSSDNSPQSLTQSQYIVDEILYTLYLREGKVTSYQHSDIIADIFEPPFINETIPTKILIPGSYLGNKPNEKLKDSYIDNIIEINVITVDWEVVKSKSLVPLQGDGAYLLAECLVKFVQALFPSGNLNNVHMVGHGIAAHAAGIAGRELQKNGHLIQRITGLDAANPYVANGLTEHDAFFVDVIHTNAQSLRKCGRADFYPNGGRGDQPSCESLDESPSVCNTLMAYEYYESTVINPRRLIAHKCDNEMDLTDGNCDGEMVYMGEYVDFGARGIYYLNIGNIFKR